MKERLMKMKENKGFTLAELLIVVAIIAVLVAVSVPVFTSKLDSAKVAADEANQRAAKAAAVAAYLSDNTKTTWYYNADTGVVAESDSGIAGYGQSSTVKDGIVKVSINASTGAATVCWDNVGESATDGVAAVK